MNIKDTPITDIKPYPNNPRKNKQAIDTVVDSIQQYGFQQPIVVDDQGVIIVGHTRYQASIKLGLKEVPVIWADELTPEQCQAYRLMDNKSAEYSKWDNDLLLDELNDIYKEFGTVDPSGFTSLEYKTLLAQDNAKVESRLSLAEKYLVNPFTILDARQKPWQHRKNLWKNMGIQSEIGRESGLTYGDGFASIGEDKSTSIFDPTLSEVLTLWFSKQGHKVLDPFAGGSVRGVVTAMLGRSYTGIDLRSEQIDANKLQWEDIKQLGYPLQTYTHQAEPTWIAGDSNKQLDNLDEEFDYILTCPPYADLEVYSDDPADISNMDYQEFREIYKCILTKAAHKLRPDRFATVVIGEARDDQGNYYNLVGDTISIMKEAGLEYYNEIILITPGGNLPIRTSRPFEATRKLGKHHQNALVFVKGEPINHHDKALVFVKGNAKNATDHAGRIEIDSMSVVFNADWDEDYE